MSARAEDEPDARSLPAPDPEPGEWESEILVDGPDTIAEERLLAPLRLRARAVNLGRVLRLVEIHRAAEAGRLDEPSRQEAETLAHQVVGSAGTFGSLDASRDAEAVEQFFAEEDLMTSWHDRGRAADVRRTLERLKGEFGG